MDNKRMWIFAFLLGCETALTLSPEECMTLQQKPVQIQDAQAIYLKAIVFADDQTWVVWLNDEKVLPQENAQIRQVTPDTLIMECDGQRITLHPNESYSPKLKRVIRGDIRMVGTTGIEPVTPTV